MGIIEHIGAGCMMTGLVFGAMTGAIAMLLIPAGAGALIFAAASWHKHQKEQTANSYRVKYPPYGY